MVDGGDALREGAADLVEILGVLVGGTPVRTRFDQSWPVSVSLILYTQVLSLLVAIPLALWAAYRSGRWTDKIINTFAFGAISLPSFAVALLLTYYLGVQMGWVPTQGYVRLTEDPGEHFRHVIVPVLALSLGQIAVYMRLLRSDLVATLQEDFILMAKSKGISNGRVLWRHALRPSSLTLLTVTGLSMGNLIGGTLVIEFLLGIPGLGVLIGETVLRRQYEALQSLVAVVAIGARHSRLAQANLASVAAVQSAEAAIHAGINQLSTNSAWNTGFDNAILGGEQDQKYSLQVTNNLAGPSPVTAPDGVSVPAGTVYLMATGALEASATYPIEQAATATATHTAAGSPTFSPVTSQARSTAAASTTNRPARSAARQAAAATATHTAAGSQAHAAAKTHAPAATATARSATSA